MEIVNFSIIVAEECEGIVLPFIFGDMLLKHLWSWTLINALEVIDATLMESTVHSIHSAKSFFFLFSLFCHRQWFIPHFMLSI